jgi:dTDP-4-amino-4,6-dideoxygalactose transaminase
LSAHEPRIIFGRPSFDESEEELVLQTIRSGWIGQGPLVERFEQLLGDYLGAEEVVTVSSCTAGLHLALTGLGIGPGDEVVTTPFTFVATIAAIVHAGATPVFVDVDRTSLNLVPAAVAAAVTPRTKAILPVHFGGRPLDSRAFHEIAQTHDLWIVEDAAHAIGAVANGRRVGGSGQPRTVAVFSFYPNKNLSSAEGGAIATSDVRLAQRLRSLRLHGFDVDAWDRYRVAEYRPSLAHDVGFKYNWTDLQAALALPQLEKLEGFLGIREYLADRYDELLVELEDVEPVDRGRSGLMWRHALHLYQVAVAGSPPRRDRIVSHLQRDGVGAAVHYIGVNQHPAYRTSTSYPVSDWASGALITLPLHPHMGDEDLERVRSALGRALAATRET